MLWCIAALVLLGGWGVFLYRGLVPGTITASDDFRVIYSSSRAWLYGTNPYDAEHLDALWRLARGSLDKLPSERGSQDLLYPPPTFVLIAPVAAFDWPVAREVWAQVNLLSIGASIIAVVTLLRARWLSPATWIFVGLAIAFAPCITGVKMGQTSMLLTALVAGCHALRVCDRPVLAGVLLGLAAVLKPQIGLVFLAYELFRGRWWVAVPAVVVAGLVVAVGIGRLVVMDVPWLESLASNVRAFTTGAGAGNPLPENDDRFQMIDFRPIIHTFTDSRVVGSVGTWGLAGLLGLGALWAWLRKQEDGRELLAISIGATACLLVVYHRFYDASVLLLPLGWVVWALGTEEGRRFGWTRWAVLLGVLPFFAPGSAFLYHQWERGRIPDWVSENVLYEVFVLHHQAWALVWLTVALVLAMLRCPDREGPALAWVGPLASRLGLRPAVGAAGGARAGS